MRIPSKLLTLYFQDHAASSHWYNTPAPLKPRQVWTLNNHLACFILTDPYWKHLLNHYLLPTLQCGLTALCITRWTHSSWNICVRDNGVLTQPIMMFRLVQQRSCVCFREVDVIQLFRKREFVCKKCSNGKNIYSFANTVVILLAWQIACLLSLN